MLEGMTSIDLGSSNLQETTGDMNDVLPDELMETPEERYLYTEKRGAGREKSEPRAGDGSEFRVN